MTTRRLTTAGRFWLAYCLLLLTMALGVVLSAHAQAANTATITFTAATQRTDGTTMTGAVSYEVWQGLKGATKTKVGTITGTSTTINTGLVGGSEYCWYIITREVGNANPSLPSNEACKAFALAAPNVVTITVN